MFGSVMAALPPIDYRQLAQTLIANVAAAGGSAGATAGGGAAPAASTAAHYGGDHMDIERVTSSMKKNVFRELRRHKCYGAAQHSDFPGSCV